ncbi:uncharacterized protein KY384_001443 [Bacidia gigantensis]|uniref:uncharacterized protein n=1 Tax=Bacidia gigantensis TaxID=2732470 RepID=UPI001D048202|nr:uncharacterized protein KY384_001443 [Bacidia gigantensis]KAG8533702.1 hypothetical protein KY384_001443 [Bacidia gigantensis]
MDSAPALNLTGQKRRLSREGAFQRDSKRAKTSDLDHIVSRCRTELGLESGVQHANIYIVPEDLGSRLYTWYLQKSRNIENSHEWAGETQDLELESLPFSKEIEEPSQPAQKPRRRPTINGRGSQSDPSSATSNDHFEGSQDSLSSRSIVDPVFSPAARNRQASSSSIPEGDDADQSVQIAEQDPPKTSRQEWRPSRIFSSKLLQMAERDVHYRETIALDRPNSFPTSWEAAHVADRMIMELRQEGVPWSSIADRWKGMTNCEDSVGYLEWRFRQLKNKLGSLSDMEPNRVQKTRPSSTFSDRSSRIEQTVGEGSVPQHRVQPSEIETANSLDGVCEESIEMIFEPRDPQTESRKSECQNVTITKSANSKSLWVRLKLSSTSKSIPTYKRPEPQKIPATSAMNIRTSSDPELKNTKHENASEFLTTPLSSTPTSLSSCISGNGPNHENVALISGVTSQEYDKHSDLATKELERRRKLSLAMSATWERRKTNGDGERHIELMKEGKAKKRAQDNSLPPVKKTPSFRDVQLSPKSEDAKRRQSETMKATWAKRIAEGRNGRFGGLPRVSTIKQAEKKARRPLLLG